MIVRGWNRVEPGRAEWAATQQPTHRQPRPVTGTVQVDRLGAVLGTGREEAAGRRAPFEGALVGTDAAEEQALSGGVVRKIDVCRRHIGPLDRRHVDVGVLVAARSNCSISVRS